MKRAALALILLLSLPLDARLRAVRSGPAEETPAAWLTARGVALESFEPGDARVVALGDATHGTHETYDAKLRLAPRLVERGFRVFAIEAPYVQMKRLDDYVVHGTGDPAEILNSPSYWFWDTDEILELVEWARAQNVAGLTPPIRIAGVDATAPAATAEYVVAELRRIDPAAADEAEANYICMLGPVYRGTEACRARVASVTGVLEAKQADPELIHAARVAEQEERVRAGGYNMRDPFIAENVLWYARDAKVVLIGHNEHWGRLPYVLADPNPIRSAGSFLAEALGDTYYAIGTVILGGTYHAVDYTGGVGVIRVHAIPAPSADDFALLLEQAGRDSMLVPLRGAVPAWLAGTHRMRFAASAVPAFDVEQDVTEKWDAVIYIRHSTPSRVRHFPTF